MAEIARRTGWTSFGLVPHLPAAARLPAEDALGLTGKAAPDGKNGHICIAVPMLPHIANFDDLDPLEAEPTVELVRVWPGTALPGDAALVLLPGSKSTIADLAALREAGFDIDLAAHVRRGGHVLGLCGGYQMLGRTISDPEGVEGGAQSVQGLGLLNVATTLSSEKRVATVAGTSFDAVPFNGYEIHMGRTTGPDCARPFARVDGSRIDGAISANGRVIGTYLHGLFANDHQRSAWLKRLGGTVSVLDYEAGVEEALDALADHLETHLDVVALMNHAAA